ncbi:hypothetical protein [Myroides sp. DW712]|uniref:hypothetical protein n=1 Tax=Myroides sp. DW712 TaxID=3389800 RepID=UPI0039780D4B
MVNRYVALIVSLLYACICFGQDKFSQGFADGYKKGFCYDKGISCIEPIPPIAPIPKIGESSTSYNDGYNRGFQEGLANQKNVNIQRERYVGAESKFVDDFIYKPPYELMERALAIKEAQFELEYQKKIIDDEVRKERLTEDAYAIINIYRPKRNMGSLLTIQVVVNGIKVADISSGGHLEYKVHDLSLTEIVIKSAGIASARLVPEKGKVYYFETKPKFSGFTLEQIFEPVSSKELKSKKYMKKVDYVF